MPTARSAGRKSRREDRESSTDAPSVTSRGRRQKRRSRFTRVPYQHKVDLLVEATQPLFAVCDAVFTEDEALSPEMRKVTLGRIYEEWQRTRKHFDPDFVASDYRRPRRTSVFREEP
jgi:hypothetical protein